MGAHHLTDAKHTLSGYHASNSWSGCMRGFLCLVMALTGCVKTTSPTTTTAGMPPVEATQAWVLYESGLRHEDMVVGSGPMVQKGSIIKAHYIGRLTDGTMFDSSYERGQPLPLTVGAGQVIRGWDEGLVGMRMGGKRTLLIPPHLGYGSGGSGAIPPNSTLLFEVEVVEVTAPRSPAAASAVVDATSMNQTESGLMWANLNDACDPIEHPVGARLAVEYDGFLESGRLFDSSRLREEPFSFALGMGRVIPGWDEGLADAPAGCKRQLVIPPHLGYGESGSRSVPPGATLTMDVEVVEVGAPRNPPMAPQSPSSFLTSPTGLQVAILSPGEGQAASGGDLVRVEYTGWLTDGSRFDSSLLRDRPIDILLGAGRVIAGWDEGLLGMRPGEVRQLVIPPGLGYGAAGKPPTIPPGATLVFEVQLVEILSSAP